MGRKIRKVPPNWEHPRNRRGVLTPMYDENYEDASREWLDGLAKWEAGENLATKGDFWGQKDGKGGWGAERARAFCAHGWAPSLLITNGKMYSSEEIPLFLEKEKERNKPR